MQVDEGFLKVPLAEKDLNIYTNMNGAKEAKGYSQQVKQTKMRPKEKELCTRFALLSIASLLLSPFTMNGKQVETNSSLRWLFIKSEPKSVIIRHKQTHSQASL